MNGLEEDSPKAHYGKINEHGAHMSAEEMDERRKQNVVYEYLCHLEEAKKWMEACINEELPPTTELEEGLMNGVYFGKLGHFMAPNVVPLKRLYDKDQARYKARGLHFRHTDNINHFLKALEDVGMPKIFYPETTDIYDRKNMPRVIYCIHALSLYLFKLGKAPQIQDLYGKIEFTDEEISAMRKELDKYGIQMPAFSKIGGILANEMPVDEAALHAAVIVINEAIDKQVAIETVNAMQNPNAHLVNIDAELANSYQECLYEAKHTKAEAARNKSMDPDSSYIPDVYDELLTQAEIQGNLNIVNSQNALQRVNDAITQQDEVMLLKALKATQLSLRDVKGDNASVYLAKLTVTRDNKINNNSGEASLLTKDELQNTINASNRDADTEYQKMVAVKEINEALDEGQPNDVLRALKNPAAQLPTNIHDFAGTLYLEEFRNMRTDKQSLLEFDDLEGGLQVLNAVAEINKAVDTNNPDLAFGSMREEYAHILNLDPRIKEKYIKAMTKAKASKLKKPCELLTHFEIQQIVNTVNQEANEENERCLAVSNINEAIDKGNAANTLQALQQPSAKLKDVDENQALHYQYILGKAKLQKAQEFGDSSAVLWYEEIQNAVLLANKQAQAGVKLATGIVAVNIAVDAADLMALMEALQNPDCFIHSVTPECSENYMHALHDMKSRKAEAGECGSGWIMNRIKEGHKFYFNSKTMNYSWERPKEAKKDHSMLTKDEIQTCVSDVTSEYDRELLYKANEPKIVKLQAHIKGYQARKSFNSRLSFIKTQLPAVIRIQSWWKMQMQKRKYQERLEYLHSQEDHVLKLQAATRMYLTKKAYRQRLKYFKNNEWAIVKIQAFVRSNWAQKDYRSLMHDKNPPLPVVRKFVHLLDHSDIDYTEEIELQKLRQQVVTEIRSNQKLEADLNTMDIKIGLLVKNRISLQEVVSQHKTLKRYREDSSSNLNQGIKALSKQSRERLENYQYLFYLLQTNPTYLAKLIFEMPQSKTTKFMETVIFTLYNYASNQREEYLLLKLFETALREEIRSKVDQMSDIVTGNPMVIKMVVTFNRNASRGQSSLRQLLNPLIQNILDDKTLHINTNPVEVYKQWVNQMESQTGKASGLPYDATPEEALKHEEVIQRINHSVDALKRATDKFFNAIIDNIGKIPYMMRYMAKVLKEALEEKFPEAQEKDILKIVGNLIYYRYINSAIVAPDAFDIIDVGASKGLTNDQRRNLGSVAKILQFAASNKGFGGDSAHLATLNPYIMEAHIKFKKYFKEICEVDHPDVHFNMDEFTDVSAVTKPVIYITIAEIIETHKLLLQHQDTIAPDHNDPLHELLDDLGDSPTIEDMVGDTGSEDGMTVAQMGKTETSLTLSNKFEVHDEVDTTLKSTLIRTKRMVVDVIRCQRKGDNLPEILETPATEIEEQEHHAIIKRRERIDNKASKKTKLTRYQSLVGDTRLPLNAMKCKVQENLEHLEKAGKVNRKNKYQGLINFIAQDIRNQRLYRQRRKQELLKTKTTLKSLATKRAFFEEQVDYYNQYVKTCMDNLAAKSKRSSRLNFFSREKDTKKAKGSIKYSAARLHEKGVILEIEGLATNQFKNVLFEISATETTGVFDVNAKFMGVNLDKVELVFQDLLQLQYEGVAVMQMFDKAKVNVNLLIFLLNKKFYGK